LDRAEAGDASRPFPSDEVAARNASDLSALHTSSGPERIADFVTSAHAYAERLRASWDLPFGFPYGTVTAGIHAGGATGEWHLHAWDLGCAIGVEHRPSDAALVYDGLGISLGGARAGGSRIAKLATPALVRASRRGKDPWALVLQRSGRT
jgi:hypothetical protein